MTWIMYSDIIGASLVIIGELLNWSVYRLKRLIKPL